jgi:hypothetical protein
VSGKENDMQDKKRKPPGEVMRQGENYEEAAFETTSAPVVKKNRKVLACMGIAIAAIILGAVFLPRVFSLPKREAAPESSAPERTQEVEIFFKYEPEELEKLRAYGYTADEIEQAERDYVSADVLIERAKEDREAVLRAGIEKVSDAASPEYKALLSQTWLGESAANVPRLENIHDYTTETKRENVDYVKLKPTGMQLLLRLELNNGIHVFMTVSPSRWQTLKDTGNIVVNYTVVQYGGAPFITNINEYEVGE